MGANIIPFAMFFKLSTIVALVPFVAALTMKAPENPTSAGQVTISWTSESSDNLFTIELHHPSFRADFAIANNVNPDEGSKTLLLPSVPVQDGYTLRAVNVTDINQVFSESPSFSIGANTATVGPSSSSGSSATGSGTAGNNSASSTAPLSVSTGSSSTFGHTLSNSNTGTGAPNSATTPSGSSTGTSTTPASTPTDLNGAAFASAKVSTAVGLLAAVAGIAVVAF
jgi:hypothetical protein